MIVFVVASGACWKIQAAMIDERNVAASNFSNVNFEEIEMVGLLLIESGQRKFGRRVTNVLKSPQLYWKTTKMCCIKFVAGDDSRSCAKTTII